MLKKGFTLIELIVVVLIVGILAAIAIPRFLNQTTNARVAALSGMGSAINSTVMIAISEFQAEGSSGTTITMSGQAVTVGAGTGYPVGSAAGIGAALRVNQGFIPTYGATTTYNFSPAVTNCFLTYNSSTAQVTITQTGC